MARMSLRNVAVLADASTPARWKVVGDIHRDDPIFMDGRVISQPGFVAEFESPALFVRQRDAIQAQRILVRYWRAYRRFPNLCRDWRRPA